MSLYRADLPRTLALVVALFLTVIAASAFAREFGAENNWPSFVTTDHYKYAGFYTLTQHTMSPEVLVMSLKAWQSLSPDDQKLFREAAQQSSRFMREKWRDLEDRSRQQAETAGITIIGDFDRKPFEAAMGGLHEKMQRDPAAARSIERIRELE